MASEKRHRFEKEHTMTQPEKALYIVNAQATAGGDDAFRGDVNPGAGNDPENHPHSANFALPRRRMTVSAVSSLPIWASFLAA
jgi:hypothetical protein